MDERGPPTVADAVHMLAVQVTFWGLVVATVIGQVAGMPFAFAGIFWGAFGIWIVVRWINRRGYRKQGRPSDETAVEEQGDSTDSP